MERQRSATPLSPVQIWLAPLKYIESLKLSIFFIVRILFYVMKNACIIKESPRIIPGLSFLDLIQVYLPRWLLK